MIKRYLLVGGVVFLMIMGLTSSAFCYSFGIEGFSTYKDVTYTYGSVDGIILDPAQGRYLGTAYGENDSEDVLKAFLKEFVGWADPVITFYGKDEDGKIWTPLTQAVDGGDISGTWQTYETTAPALPDVVEFIIVKAGNNFSVHQYDPAASHGEWNIGYIPNAGGSGSPATLSHLSAYNGSVPVPEPTTILLSGIGLLGMGAYLRRRKTSK